MLIAFHSAKLCRIYTAMDLKAIICESEREFGLELKEKQIMALEAILGGSDVFVSLPTGYGKSVIYALLRSRNSSRMLRSDSVYITQHGFG